MALTYECHMGAKCAEIKAHVWNDAVKRICLSRVIIG